MSNFSFINTANFNILIVGIALGSIALLGFTVYFNNRKSITNKAFLFYCLAVVLWGLSNFLEYQFQTTESALWALRIHLFISVWYSLAFFTLSYVFLKDESSFPKWYKFFVVPFVIITSLVTLTPLVFVRIISLAPAGQVTVAQIGPGIALFGLTAFGLLVAGVVILFRRALRSNGVEKKQLWLIFVGMLLTACLTLTFNLVLPIIFQNVKYIPFAALFVLPFIIFISYNIYKHHLFRIKVIAVVFVAFILTIFSLFNVIYATGPSQIILNASFFVLILVGSIILIQSIIREVEQRERLEILKSALEDANEKLKGLDKLKNEFLSLASHQLRSPLTAIKGYSSMIVDGDFGEINAKAKEAVERVFQSSVNLARIVEDLLNVSKIEQGGMKYEMAPFNLCEVSNDMSKDLSIVAEKKGLKLSFDTASDAECMVNGDREKIRQVVLNLIDNAIKYTKEGSIVVSVKKENNKIKFAVKDNGMGMTPEIKATLFQKFARGEGARMNTSGSGLGLYLAKQIVEAHKGTIDVMSDGPGKGSTFAFELDAIKQ